MPEDWEGRGMLHSCYLSVLWIWCSYLVRQDWNRWLMMQRGGEGEGAAHPLKWHTTVSFSAWVWQAVEVLMQRLLQLKPLTPPGSPASPRRSHRRDEESLHPLHSWIPRLHTRLLSPLCEWIDWIICYATLRTHQLNRRHSHPDYS